jgi:hypothetical protein
MKYKEKYTWFKINKNSLCLNTCPKAIEYCLKEYEINDIITILFNYEGEYYKKILHFIFCNVSYNFESNTINISNKINSHSVNDRRAECADIVFHSYESSYMFDNECFKKMDELFKNIYSYRSKTNLRYYKKIIISLLYNSNPQSKIYIEEILKDPNNKYLDIYKSSITFKGNKSNRRTFTYYVLSTMSYKSDLFKIHEKNLLEQKFYVFEDEQNLLDGHQQNLFKRQDYNECICIRVPWNYETYLQFISNNPNISEIMFEKDYKKMILNI